MDLAQSRLRLRHRVCDGLICRLHGLRIRVVLTVALGLVCPAQRYAGRESTSSSTGSTRKTRSDAATPPHCGTQTPAPGTTRLKSIFSPSSRTRTSQPPLDGNSKLLLRTIARCELCSSTPNAWL